MAVAGRNDLRTLLEFARTVEAREFAERWANDPLTARPRCEPLTVLAAPAAATERIRLGIAASLAPLRHPLLSPHAIATLDRLASGRPMLGPAAESVAARSASASGGLSTPRMPGARRGGRQARPTQAFCAGEVGACAEWLACYARAGARHVVVGMGSSAPEVQFERLAETLLPALAAA